MEVSESSMQPMYEALWSQMADTSTRTKKWTPPPSGILKCNIEAFWYSNREVCGAGLILRDETRNMNGMVLRRILGRDHVLKPKF